MMHDREWRRVVPLKRFGHMSGKRPLMWSIGSVNTSRPGKNYCFQRPRGFSSHAERARGSLASNLLQVSGPGLARGSLARATRRLAG